MPENEKLFEGYFDYKIFFDLYKIISSTLNITELLNLTLEIMLNTIKAEVGILFLIDKNSNQFIEVSNRGLTKKICESIFYNEENLIEIIKKLEKPALFKNLKIKNKDKKIFIKSILTVPLISKNNKIGYALLANKTSKEKVIDFENSDKEIISILSSAFSVAIENSLLYEEMVKLKNFNLGIINSLNSGVITFDMDKRLNFYNKSAEFILNLNQSSLGLEVEKILSNIENEKLKIILDGINRNENILNMKAELKTETGEKKILNFSLSNLKDVQDKVIGYIISFDDISEKEFLETQLLRTEKLAALGELSAGIAHEIKNPLTSIKGFTQLLPKKLDDKEFLLKFANIIENETKRLNSIIENLLEFAKPKIKKYEILNLNEPLRRALELLNPKLKSANIEVELELSETPEIYGEIDKLEQVFINIILNSIDAMENGGKLIIKSKTLIKRGPENIFMEYATIYFTDTGKGIKEEDIDKLFNPFWTTKEKGTGLGLSISHRIITEHKGLIEVKSKYNQGTTFIIYLPTVNNF
jgi:signal transduction histidine kinase